MNVNSGLVFVTLAFGLHTLTVYNNGGTFPSGSLEGFEAFCSLTWNFPYMNRDTCYQMINIVHNALRIGNDSSPAIRKGHIEYRGLCRSHPQSYSLADSACSMCRRETYNSYFAGQSILLTHIKLIVKPG